MLSSRSPSTSESVFPVGDTGRSDTLAGRPPKQQSLSINNNRAGLEATTNTDMHLRVSVCIHSFIHSFIHSIRFYSASSCLRLHRSAPDTARILCRSFTPNRNRKLRVKDLSRSLRGI